MRHTLFSQHFQTAASLNSANEKKTKNIHSLACATFQKSSCDVTNTPPTHNQKLKGWQSVTSCSILVLL